MAFVMVFALSDAELGENPKNATLCLIEWRHEGTKRPKDLLLDMEVTQLLSQRNYTW
jgi:tRNA A37 threonylcarbamoyladenosine biosynthesis protein TsaE